MIQVYRDLNDLPQFKRAVVTIGTFDGVHLGHQQIIKLLTEEAKAIGGETLIITFHPHPRKVVSGGRSEVKTLNTLEEKTILLGEKGIQHLVVTPFDEAFASLPAEDYIRNFLVKKFQPHTIIIGYDHRFGKDRAGDYHLLEDLGKQFGYEVKEIPGHVLNEVTISSTKIREALLKSDVETAGRFLGYPYFFEGKVVEGNRLGRTIGYPTANLVIEDPEKLVPGNGVYAVRLTIGAEKAAYNGMMNIGMRPTVDGTKQTIEVNIFDFDHDIYGQYMQVHLYAFLRGEVKFAGLDKLKEQLAQDKINALEQLKDT